MARRLLIVLLFVLLAVAHTWPLATGEGLRSLANEDAMLNAWILGWVVHQLGSDPLHLFDANIFYPEPRTLTFSEPLILPAVLGAPARWLGVSAVVTHNLLVLAGMALSALAGYLLARRLSLDRSAALLAGVLLGFNAHTLTRVPHIQAQYLGVIALVFLVFDRLLMDRRRADVVLLALAVVAAALTSGYAVVLAVVGLGVAVLARADEWMRERPGNLFGLLAGATILGGFLVLPVAIPYWLAGAQQGLERPLSQVQAFAITPLSYVATASRFHYVLWAQGIYERAVGTFFPGVTALALATAALWRGGVLRQPRGRMLLAVGVAGFVLSLGPATPVYRALYAALPPLRGLRDPSRFGYLFLFAIALLAAAGLQRLTRRVRRRGLLAAGLIVLATLEMLHGPRRHVLHPEIAPVYGVIAAVTEPSVVVEMPFPPRDKVIRNVGYVLASTAHWKPLLNGFSGFIPHSYRRRAVRLRGFPDRRSLREMRRVGVTHVVVHLDRYPPDEGRRLLTRIQQRSELELLARERQIRVYRLLAASAAASSRNS